MNELWCPRRSDRTGTGVSLAACGSHCWQTGAS
jgi:hypothetical protein